MEPLHEFVQDLLAGYDTVLGEGGAGAVSLS
jgi:ABC-type multidrug transport system fused ATPase/permease subunit